MFEREIRFKKCCRFMLHGICKKCDRRCPCYKDVKKGSVAWKRGIVK
jgi:hypothetical protein